MFNALTFKFSDHRKEYCELTNCSITLLLHTEQMMHIIYMQMNGEERITGEGGR